MAYEKELAVLAAAYLIGTLNPAYLLGKVKGVDLRRKGEFKNYSASNIRSVLGWRLGIAVAAIDLLKGVAAACLPIYLGLQPVFAYAASALVVIGHRFPFYLGFKGGKGVAAGSGAFGFLLLFRHNLFSLGFAVAFFVYAVAVSPKFRKRLLGFIGIKG